ncbi:MAG: squalene synthase HpnC [Nocardioidaceae bacterium]
MGRLNSVDGPSDLRSPAAENFPVALRLLPARHRAHLMAIYGYARYVDDLGDEFEGDRTNALNQVADDVRRVCAGEQARDSVVAGLLPFVREKYVPADPFLRLVDANRQDQLVTRYRTFEDLVSYCELSANPVGELVLRVFDQADPERIALSDQVCTALQVIEHLQDVAEDHRNGRIYLPLADLARFGVEPADLGHDHASPAVRVLIDFEAERARGLLDSGTQLVPKLRGWARLAVSGYVAGGRSALAGLGDSGRDPLAEAVKPTRGQVVGQWLRGFVRSPRWL